MMNSTNVDNEAPVSVPYVVYRDSVSHNHWVVRTLVRALIVVAILMFASNVAWLIVWSSYDYESMETIVDSTDNGIANYTGGNGGINYGPGDSAQDDQDEAQREPGDENPEVG